MKKLAAVVVVLLLICGGALWFLASGSLNEYLNDFVKKQIESQGSRITGQQVAVAQVDLKVMSGAGTIKGITLSNPEGYQQDNAFSLGEITLDIDPASLKEEPYVIEKFIINDPEFVIELTESAGSNIQDIYQAISANLPKSAPQPNEQSSKESPDPRIIVNQLTLAGIGLSVDLSRLGNQLHKKTLPAIELGSIGGEQGLPASQLGGEILKRITKSVWEQAKQEQKEQLKEEVKEKVKEKAEKELGKLLDKFGG